MSRNANSDQKGAAPNAIPLPFDRLVEGILKVDTAKLPPKAKPGVGRAKKATPKKRAKKR